MSAEAATTTDVHAGADTSSPFTAPGTLVEVSDELWMVERAER